MVIMSGKPRFEPCYIKFNAFAWSRFEFEKHSIKILVVAVLPGQPAFAQHWGGRRSGLPDWRCE